MKKIFYLIVFAVLLTNCGEKKSEESYAVEEMTTLSPATLQDDSKALNDESNTTVEALTPVEQKIIKTGHFTFETTSTEKTFDQLKKSVNQNKGYIQSDETTKYNNKLSRSLIIRIPNTGFQPVIDSLTKNVKIFDEQKIDLQDVTEEFFDIEARMKAKKELENRYLQLLNKANSIKDMLEIERQLSQIREEIEAQEGRLKYLQNRVSFSTLHINFYEIIDVQHAPSKSYFSRLGYAIKNGFTGIGEFIIGITTLWPLLILIALVVYFVRKRLKNRNKDAKN